MRFIIPEGGVGQYSLVRVICSLRIMAEILSILTQRTVEAELDWLQRSASAGISESFMFRHGAKLVFDHLGQMHIHGYHYSGQDILAAIDELKMAHALREANRHSERMHDRMRSYTLRDGVKHYPKLDWKLNYNVLVSHRQRDQFRRKAS